MENFSNAILELIKKTSCVLPEDVKTRIRIAYDQEDDDTPAKNALLEILTNIDIAEQKSLPLCQDTGTNYFIISYPYNMDFSLIKEKVVSSVIKATESYYLRPNSVDSLTGKNSGDNTGPGHPSIDLIPVKNDYIEVKLMLKGGGCENMGMQYSLPDDTIDAGRDIKGIKKVILNSVLLAQGYGCAPGILGVCIGGDRADSLKAAKKELFKNLDFTNPDSELAAIESEIFQKSNLLGIGPMGYGGKTTLLGLHITKLNRIPASFFVSISYMCWACRRRTLKYYPDGRFEID